MLPQPGEKCNRYAPYARYAPAAGLLVFRPGPAGCRATPAGFHVMVDETEGVQLFQREVDALLADMAAKEQADFCEGNGRSCS
jgi:hypothetical protein